ncbi:hypothetical protein SBA2_80043 [Acidobacteriia bacterium SbA2]|nr:hypothetical protein SBA2_80043 [Acidobacteriia bacterium SbA2]
MRVSGARRQVSDRRRRGGPCGRPSVNGIRHFVDALDLWPTWFAGAKTYLGLTIESCLFTVTYCLYIM